MINIMDQDKQISIKDMTYNEARDFLLKPESYCTISLPEYIDFTEVIKIAVDRLKTNNGRELRKLHDLYAAKKKLKEFENVNYTFMQNKNGEYSWRPITLIHPLIYVDLVNCITIKKNWAEIVEVFNKPRDIIKGKSLPVGALSAGEKDIKRVILNWWEEFEQLQIKKSMEYKYCMHTDISNCYPSIYTHSIPWAIMGKERAKENRSTDYFPNELDALISNMQYGQTNGIPQGSVLMDFIAEIVLNGVDLEIEKKLAEYKDRVEIFRYRDDYRIFGNTIEDVHEVTKYISEILAKWNFSLNSNKTFLSKDIISDAFKKGKRYWQGKQPILKDLNAQQHLLQIKELADKFPNSGSLKKALNDFHTKYFGENNQGLDSKSDISSLISILVDIMDNNSIVIEFCVVIISEMLSLISVDEAGQYLDHIYNRFKNYPNSDYVDIWLQRLNLPYNKSSYREINFAKKVVGGFPRNIWNHDWLHKKFDEESIVNRNKIEDLDRKIDMSNIDAFAYVSSE